MPNNKSKSNTSPSTRQQRSDKVRQLVVLALLSAIGIILVALIEVPIFSTVPFLKYDPGDIVIAMGAMQFGIVPGLMMNVVIRFVQSFMLHGSSGPVGFAMNATASTIVVVVLGLTYRRKTPTTKNMVLSFVAAGLSMAILMGLFNLFVMPAAGFFSKEAVLKILIPFITPFNLIKAAINSVVCGLLTKALEPAGVFKPKR